MGELQVLHAVAEIDGGETGSSVLLAAGFCGPCNAIICGAVSPHAVVPQECELAVLPAFAPGGGALRAVRDIYAYLRARRPEIVHAHGFRAGFLARSAALAWKYFGGGRAVKLVYTPHGGPYCVGWRRVLADCADRMLAHFTAALVALSRAEVSANLHAGVGYAGQWVVVPPALAENFAQEFADHDVFAGNRARVRETLGVPPDAVTLLYCGGLFPRRGLGELLTAFSVVKKRLTDMCAQGEIDPEFQARLVLAGEGPEEERLKQMAHALDLEDWVIFSGWRDDAAKLMSACDALAEPAYGVRFSRAVIEAQAAGLAVVCTDAGGLTGSVEAGRTALTAQAGSAESLAAALLAVLTDPALRTDLGMRGREWMAETDLNGFPRFAKGAFVLRHQQLYDYAGGH